MKLFIGVTPRSWSWALAFVAGSYAGPLVERPVLYMAALAAAIIVGTAIEKFET